MLVGFLPLGIGLLSQVESKTGFASCSIRSVTFEAAVRKDRANIAIELELICGSKIDKAGEKEARNKSNRET
jgi:hypothetical protein